MSLAKSKDPVEKIIVRFILLQLLKKVQSEVRITFAKTKEEYRQAYYLVYEKYFKKGLINMSKEEFFEKEEVDQFPISNKIIAIAKKQNKVVATSTLVLDNYGKLPCEKTYPLQVKALIKEGRRIVEFTRLAAKDNMCTLLRTFRFLFKCALRLGASDILIEVHPKHAIFYEKFFLFERIGDLKIISHLNNAPAYLCRLDLLTIEERMYQKFAKEKIGKDYCDFFFKKQLPEDILLTKLYNFNSSSFRKRFINLPLENNGNSVFSEKKLVLT